MICKAGGITKREIGTIRIENRETHVELNAEVAERFFAHLDNGRLEKNIVAMPMREGGGHDERPQRAERQERPRRDDRQERPHTERAPERQERPQQREAWSPDRQDRQERPAAASRPGRKERQRMEQRGKPPASKQAAAAGKPNKKKKKKWTPAD